MGSERSLTARAAGPPPAKPTPRQREIVEQAIELIARRGIQELTIRHLARELGITDPAIYRHFASKTEILMGVLDVLERETLHERPAAAAGGDNPVQALESRFSALFKRLASAPALAAVVFADEAFLNEEPLAERVRELMDRTQRLVERLVTSAQDAGALRNDIPAQVLATMLVGSVRFVVRRWHVGGHEFDLVREGRAVVSGFLTVAAV